MIDRILNSFHDSGDICLTSRSKGLDRHEADVLTDAHRPASIVGDCPNDTGHMSSMPLIIERIAIL